MAKAKVEVAVQVTERWVLAALRNHLFHPLEDLHEAVVPLRERLDLRPMRRLGRSRRELFEELERAALRPLPERPDELAWRACSRVIVA